MYYIAFDNLNIVFSNIYFYKMLDLDNLMIYGGNINFYKLAINSQSVNGLEIADMR